MQKLSIIVPVYNVKEYITKCVDSILNQTFTDFELILVDDGSTDGSEDVCDQYKQKDNRIKVIHQTNQGLSVARNSGLDIAKSEYIGFVDSDDWLEPLMFEKMINNAKENNADIVICRNRWIKENGTIEKICGYNDKIVMDKWEATKEILKDELLPSFAWNKIYKRNLFDGVRYPIGRIFEDTATTYKLIYKSNIVVTIPYIGYNYRRNSNGLCMSHNTDIFKKAKRELDNAIAFTQRYDFAKNTTGLEDVVEICANKAYLMARSFLHMTSHKKIRLTKEQTKDIEWAFGVFELKHLKSFSLLDRIDIVLFRFSKKILYAYVTIIPIFHKMND